MSGKHLTAELVISPSLRGQGVGTVRQRILRLTADLVALGHLLGRLPHRKSRRVFRHRRRYRQQILDPQCPQNIEALLQIARLVEIHQGAGQLLAHSDRQYGGG